VYSDTSLNPDILQPPCNLAATTVTTYSVI
jgi:hypothetical protein